MRKPNPTPPDPLAGHLRRIEALRKRIMLRPQVEGGGWLMGFTFGFAEGLKHRKAAGPPKLPPPLFQMPPPLAWEKAHFRSRQAAWEILLETGLDFGLHFVAQGEERARGSFGEEKAHNAFVLGYEEGLLIGFAMGKHLP